MQDKSVIQPVLRAVESMQGSPEELGALYRIVDQFCAEWIGRPRERMLFEGDAVLYLTHDLLGEYLRLEENNKRVAFWLLTLNRCCWNFGADLSQARRELAEALRSADLSLDTTLLEPVFAKIREYEAGHSRAAEEQLGRGDQLGPFLQWGGIYCGYVYPVFIHGSDPVNRTVIGSITFLLSEYIKLRSNAFRIAALLLAIKEACAVGTGARAEVPAGDGAVPAGRDLEYVEALLGRLRSEGERKT